MNPTRTCAGILRILFIGAASSVSCSIPPHPFGPRDPASRRRAPSPDPPPCPCSPLQVRCRWVRGTAPLPPSPLVAILPHMVRKRRGGTEVSPPPAESHI